MSAEKTIFTEINNLPPLATPQKSEKVLLSGRVDINHLVARIRKEQQKETQSNFIFFGLFFALIVVVGIILSF